MAPFRDPLVTPRYVRLPNGARVDLNSIYSYRPDPNGSLLVGFVGQDNDSSYQMGRDATALLAALDAYWFGGAVDNVDGGLAERLKAPGLNPGAGLYPVESSNLSPSASQPPAAGVTEEEAWATVLSALYTYGKDASDDRRWLDAVAAIRAWHEVAR